MLVFLFKKPLNVNRFLTTMKFRDFYHISVSSKVNRFAHYAGLV